MDNDIREGVAAIVATAGVATADVANVVVIANAVVGAGVCIGTDVDVDVANVVVVAVFKAFKLAELTN